MDYIKRDEKRLICFVVDTSGAIFRMHTVKDVKEIYIRVIELFLSRDEKIMFEAII